MGGVGIRIHFPGQEARLQRQQAEGVDGGRVTHGLWAHGFHPAADGQAAVTHGIDGALLLTGHSDERILLQRVDGGNGIGGFASWDTAMIIGRAARIAGTWEGSAR